mmetsp:Transcript_56808/g.134080  ORF Transcript_56808/g.134080 Transcript_56808/m.134080 type:complete len:101 (-) Transcript_56808:92-394(-)
MLASVLVLAAVALPAAAAFAPGAAPALARGGPVALRKGTCTTSLNEEKGGGGLFGGLFGGGGKKDENADVEDAIDDWKEIGFDIDAVIKAEEEAKKKDKK